MYHLVSCYAFNASRPCLSLKTHTSSPTMQQTCAKLSGQPSERPCSIQRLLQCRANDGIQQSHRVIADHATHTTYPFLALPHVHPTAQPNKNSFITGALLNSGFNTTQFKKYCNPFFLLSKKFGLNFATTPFGGRVGIEASERGKVIVRCSRKVRKSLYRFWMCMGDPWNILGAEA